MNNSRAWLTLLKRAAVASFAFALVMGQVPASAWAEGFEELAGASQEQAESQDDTSGDITGVGNESVASDAGEQGAVEGGASSISLSSLGPTVTADKSVTLTYRGSASKVDIHNAIKGLDGGFFYKDDYKLDNQIAINSSTTDSLVPKGVGTVTYSVYQYCWARWSYQEVGTIKFVEIPSLTLDNPEVT